MKHAIFRASIGWVLSLLLVSTSATAHHSFAVQYDPELPITIQGLVTKVEWTNPHVYFYMDVVGEDDQIATWAFEMVAPLVLERRGWTRNTLQVGEIIEVEGFLARDGTPLASASSLLVTRTGQRYSGTISQTVPDDTR